MNLKCKEDNCLAKSYGMLPQWQRNDLTWAIEHHQITSHFSCHKSAHNFYKTGFWNTGLLMSY